MKKIYNAPEYEIEKFTITTDVFTASTGGIIDGDTDVDTEF